MADKEDELVVLREVGGDKKLEMPSGQYLCYEQFVDESASARKMIVLRIDNELSLMSGDLFLDREQSYLEYSFISEVITTRQFGSHINALVDIIPSMRTRGYTAAKALLTIQLTDKGKDRLILSPHAVDPIQFEIVEYTEALRSVSLRVGNERGIQIPAVFSESPDHVQRPKSNLDKETINGIFQQSGVRLDVSFLPEQIQPGNGSSNWQGWTKEELHAAISTENGNINRKVFEANILFASQMKVEPNKRPPSGVMFDSDGEFPRQGAAVFMSTIGSNYSDSRLHERMVLYTTVHELGHIFNLLHSFQKDHNDRRAWRARPAALSWMNYPKRYPFGKVHPEGWNGAELFWDSFEVVRAFDREELVHIRHGAYEEIVMGGPWLGRASDESEFLSEPETNDENGDLTLELIIGENQGNHLQEFRLGEQIRGFVRLANHTKDPQLTPRGCQIDDDTVKILIRSPSSRLPRVFKSIFRQCEEATGMLLQPGEYMEAELPILYGTMGWYISEPGSYELQAICQLPDGRRCASSRRSVRVLPDSGKGGVQNWLFTPKMGQFLSLDGSRASRFEGIREDIARFINDYPIDPLSIQLADLTSWMDVRPMRVSRSITSDDTRFSAVQGAMKRLEESLGHAVGRGSFPSRTFWTKVLLDCCLAVRDKREPEGLKQWHRERHSAIQRLLWENGESDRLVQWAQRIIVNELMNNTSVQ